MSAAGVQQLLVLVGTFAFALSGALLGVRRRFDVVGMAVLATVTALGGGVVRDVLLGVLPPVALRDTWLLLLPLAATAVTFFFHPLVDRLRLAVEVTDAVGLGVFCATAAATATALGAHPVAAVLLGAVSGVGGGVARDVLAGVVPVLFQVESRLYAVPAVLGCAAVVAAAEAGATGTAVQALGAAGIVALRLLALWRGWSAPVPRLRG